MHSQVGVETAPECPIIYIMETSSSAKNSQYDVLGSSFPILFHYEVDKFARHNNLFDDLFAVEELSGFL